MELTGYSKDLLILYEENGEEWAVYMKELLLSAHSIGICLFNLDSGYDEMFEQLIDDRYQCKLMVLTNVLLKSLTEKQSTVLTQLLHPSQNVVILPCGVQSMDEFYELVRLNRDSQIFHADQDPEHYISVVLGILSKGYPDINEESSLDTPDEDTAKKNTDFFEIAKLQIPSTLVLPRRILCEAPGELCIVLSDEIPNNEYVEVEFCTEKFVIRKRATQWNEKVLRVIAPDLPAGPVSTNIWHGDIIKASTEIEYYTATGEIEHLLSKVIDPITFICQAFNVYSLEDLDMVLMKSLQRRMSSCEFSLHEIIQHTNNGSSEEIPTLLHCAAKFGLKEVTLLLMRCQGADQISRITNKYGDDPAKIAEKHGHSEIQKLIHQLTQKENPSNDAEHLNQEPEEVYVDMVPSPNAETYDNGSKESTFHGEKEISHKQSSEQEQNDQGYSQYEDSTEDVQVTGRADSPVDIMKDETDSKATGVHLFWDDASNRSEKEEEKTSQTIEFHSSSDTDDENMFLPLLFENNMEQVQNDYQMFTTGLLPSDDATIFAELEDRFLLKDSQGIEEEFNNSRLSWNDQDEFTEDKTDNGNEEPLSSDDELYILFEPSEHAYRKHPTDPGQDIASEEVLLSALEYGSCISPGTPEESVYGNLYYTEEENNDKTDDETLVVATTEDDVYIVFETSVKDKGMPQLSSIPKYPTASDAWGISELEAGKSYNDQDYIEEMNNQHLSQNEDSKYLEESKRDEVDDDEPHVVASTDDDVYIVFQTSVKNKPSGQPCLAAHHSVAAGSPLNSQWESGAYSIDKGVKEYGNPVDTCWDETIDEDTYSETDPYSIADEDIYMEFPFNNSDTEDRRDGKPLLFQRAPAPAPRVGVRTPENNASYISQVFHQKQDEKKLYGTMAQPALQQKPEEKKIYSTLSHPDKMSTASHESHVQFQRSLPTGQDELILLQEKVKLGIISMDEALHKFQLWQNEKTGLDLLQQKKLRQLRDSIIGDKPEEEVYDKITIVHQPNSLPATQRNHYRELDNSIYQRAFKPGTPPILYPPIKKDCETHGRTSPRL